MTDKTNITVIDGGNTPNVTMDSVRKLRSDLPAILEYLAILAILQREKFDQLRKNGFTEDQALELCKSVF